MTVGVQLNARPLTQSLTLGTRGGSLRFKGLTPVLEKRGKKICVTRLEGGGSVRAGEFESEGEGGGTTRVQPEMAAWRQEPSFIRIPFSEEQRKIRVCVGVPIHVGAEDI